MLVIISQGPLAGQNLLEALSATLVLATFGLELKVCFKDDAIHLLKPPQLSEQTPHNFKLAYGMVESFEFYDLFPVLVTTNSDSQHELLTLSPLEHQVINIDNVLLNQFDQVLYW